MNSKNKKIRKVLLIGIFLIFLFMLYSYNPQHNIFFPKCPIYQLTGWQCPGCGSQRAIHCLMHLDFIQAFRYNAIMVFSIPYVVFGIYLEYFNGKSRHPQMRKFLFGEKACYLLLVIITIFTVGRNLIG